MTVRDPKAFHGKALSKETKKISAPYKAGAAKFRKPDKVFVSAVSDTSLRLLKEIVAKETGEDNILISPDSVLTALAMVETGAAGKTRSEMADAMGGISAGKFRQYLASFHDTLTSASGTDYRIANSVWFRNDGEGLKEKYLQNTVTYFGAEIFAAPRNRLRAMLPRLTTSTFSWVLYSRISAESFVLLMLLAWAGSRVAGMRASSKTADARIFFMFIGFIPGRFLSYRRTPPLFVTGNPCKNNQ